MSSVLFTFEPLDDENDEILEDDPVPGLVSQARRLDDGIVERTLIFRDPEALDEYLHQRERVPQAP